MNIVICGSHLLPKTQNINQQVEKALSAYLNGVKDKHPDDFEKLELKVQIIGKSLSPKLIQSICERVGCQFEYVGIKWDKYPNKFEAPKETHDEYFRKAKLIYIFDDKEDEKFTEWVLDRALDLEVDVRKYKVKRDEES